MEHICGTAFHLTLEPLDPIQILEIRYIAKFPPRTPTRQTCQSVLFLNNNFVTDVFTVSKKVCMYVCSHMYVCIYVCLFELDELFITS